MSKIQHWINQNIPNQAGKTFLVTGANKGLGFEITKILLSKGAHVIMAGRSKGRLDQAESELVSIYPKAKVNKLLLDLADLKSVVAAAEKLDEYDITIDCLINNAGVMSTPYGQTAQGIEQQFGINHLGHFLFTKLVLPQIDTEEGRVVNMSSIAHRQASGEFQPFISQEEYSPFGVYANSKLANILFTYKLNQIFDTEKVGISAYMAHPGVSSTDLFNVQLPSWVPGITSVTKFMIESFVGQSAQMGALGAVYVATADKNKLDEKMIYGPKLDDGKSGRKGFPVASRVAANLTTEELIEDLWQKSNQLITQQTSEK